MRTGFKPRASGHKETSLQPRDPDRAPLKGIFGGPLKGMIGLLLREFLGSLKGNDKVPLKGIVVFL